MRWCVLDDGLSVGQCGGLDGEKNSYWVHDSR